jgi:TRAP-type C4-dicarboxylate transport system permease small subunit
MACSPAGEARAPRSAFDAVTGAMNAVGTLWIFVLMVLINADIIGRSGFNRPLQGVNAVVSRSIVGIVFLQLAHTLRSGRFLRSELLAGLLARWPAAARALATFHSLLGAAMMAVMFYFGLPHFVEAWEMDLFVGTFGQFTFPLWPVHLVFLVGVVATALQFLLLAADAARGRALGHPAPVAE